MKHKYKILKARDVESLVFLMNRNDLKTGYEHDYQIVIQDNSVYAVYKAVFDRQDEINGSTEELRR